MLILIYVFLSLDFDQFIVDFANIKHDRTALKNVLSHNSARQHPTTIIVDKADRDQLSQYVDYEHLHSSIMVNPSLNAKERAQYKIDMSMILGRKIYRQYKKLIH